MRTRTIDVTYERGVLKPKVKLPFREHAKLKLTITLPAATDPVTRTRGIIKVSRKVADAIIAGDDDDFFAS